MSINGFSYGRPSQVPVPAAFPLPQIPPFGAPSAAFGSSSSPTPSSSIPFKSSQKQQRSLTTTFEGTITATKKVHSISSPLSTSPASASWSCSTKLEPASHSAFAFGGPTQPAIKAVFTLSWTGETPFNGSAVIKAWELNLHPPHAAKEVNPTVSHLEKTLKGGAGSVEVVVCQRGGSFMDPVMYKVELVISTEVAPTVSLDSAVASSLMLTSPHPNDVCFLFSDGRTLWANSTSLRRSPYLESLLSSSFSEGQKRLPSSSTSTATGYQPDFDDSDAEDPDDESPINLRDNGRSGTEHTPCSSMVHEIPVSSASYITYHSLLCWLHCSHIDFAPLSSSLLYPSPSSSSPPISRSSYIHQLSSKQPSLPLASSPKSIYRLADLLELKELKELALKEFKKQLRVENVAVELFGDTSERFEEVGEACLGFTVENWAKVSISKSMLKVIDETEKGLRNPDPKISLRLATRLGRKAMLVDQCVC